MGEAMAARSACGLTIVPERKFPTNDIEKQSLSTRIGVIIPVVNFGLAVALLKNIYDNGFAPAQVFVIDNTGMHCTFPEPLNDTTLLTVHVPRQPLSVNHAWSLGFSTLRDLDLITVLNDDLLIERHFFEKIAILSSILPTAGVLCPQTVENPLDVFNTPDRVWIENMENREGWAYTIRTDVLRQVPPFPVDMKTFFGDDWLWKFTRLQGYGWWKVQGCRVYHYQGVTTRRTGIRSSLREEKKVFNIWSQKYLP